MKILMVTATYLPSTNGVAITIANLKDSLEELGHEVKVLAPDNKESKSISNVIRYPSLPNPLIKDYPIPLFPGIRSIYELITSFKPDIIHVHHPFHVGYFAKIIADRFKIPLIFTFHTRYDLYAEKYVDFLPKNLKVEFIENSLDKFCDKVDLIISPSQNLTAYLKKRMPYIDIETAPAPISKIKKYQSSKISLRRSLKLPEKKIILLTVARLGIEKNLETLIKSIKYLSSKYLLLIVGEGPDGERLKNIVKKKGLINKVKFAGLVQHQSIGKYYQASDVFCFPSQTETQGLVFLEALTYGLPVIAIDSPAAEEWITDKTGILTKNDPVELSKKLKSLTENQLTLMSQSALVFSKNFGKRKLANKFLEIYKKTVSRKNLAYKLLETGWQSWSPMKKRVLKYPGWNYKPNKDFYLPDQTNKLKLKKPVTGWCSWYCFGRDINENKIINQAKWFNNHTEIPIEYLLIDDGWARIGDWDKFDESRFPNGIKNLVKELKTLDFKTGIWMAPFLVDPKSEFFDKNKNLLVKRNGNYVTGLRMVPIYDLYNPFYILDVRKKKAREIVTKNIDLLLGNYGINLIKLDFLYSIFFIPGITEKEAGYYIRNIFLYIRKNYPRVYTIACGAPLAPLVGTVDAMRIGSDTISPVTSGWRFLDRLLNLHKLNLVFDSIQRRKWTSRYWNLDPDVFVCRESLGLPTEQILKLQSEIVKVNGNIFLGDDMTTLSKDRIEKFIKPLFK